MDSFDKKIKDSLSTYEDRIPLGMSWDEMAPGIHSKMEKPESKRTIVIFIISFLVLGLSGITAKYLWTAESEHPELSINQIKSSVTTNANNQFSKSDNPNSIEKNSTFKDHIIHEANETASIIENKIHSSNAYSKDFSKSKLPLHASATQQTIIKEELAISSEQEESIHYDKQSSSLGRGSFDHNNLKHASIETFILTSDLTTDLEIPTISDLSKRVNPSISFGKPYYLALDGGITMWDWNQDQNDSNVQLENYEREQLSYNINAAIGFSLGKHLSLESGLLFKSFESEFNGIFSNYSTEMSDTIQQPIYNVITRVTTYDGLAEVNVLEKRTVRHFNSIKQFSIPVILAVHHSNSNWDLSFGLGTSIDFLAIQHGKSINYKGELVAYEENSPLKKFSGFSGLIKTEIAYNLGNELFLYNSVKFNHSLTNWTNHSESVRLPYDFSINFGIKKVFGKK